jgi:CRP-like cAMP-binding protein
VFCFDKNSHMKNVGTSCPTLVAPTDLAAALRAAGKSKSFQPTDLLFRAGEENKGVFVVCSGKVCLQVPDAPHLDRVFSNGSVLGLPSTFSENPYCLTAACVTECEIVQVKSRKFLELMKSNPELCREATDILGRETTFILSAIRNYPHEKAS